MKTNIKFLKKDHDEKALQKNTGFLIELFCRSGYDPYRPPKMKETIFPIFTKIQLEIFFIALINDLRYSRGKKRTERTKNFLIYILFSERVFHVICLLISKKSTFILVHAMAGKVTQFN